MYILFYSIFTLNIHEAWWTYTFHIRKRFDRKFLAALSVRERLLKAGIATPAVILECGKPFGFLDTFSRTGQKSTESKLVPSQVVARDNRGRRILLHIGFKPLMVDENDDDLDDNPLTASNHG